MNTIYKFGQFCGEYGTDILIYTPLVIGGAVAIITLAKTARNIANLNSWSRGNTLANGLEKQKKDRLNRSD